MSKEDIIECFLDYKGRGNVFQLTLTNKDIDVIANEIERLQSKNKKIQTILRTRARQDRKRKAKLRKLRLETTNQRLKLEKLHSIVKEVREYIMTELTTEWNIKNSGYVSGSDLPVDAIIPILEILDKE